MAKPYRIPQRFFDGIADAPNEEERAKARKRAMDWICQNTKGFRPGSYIIIPDPETGEDVLCKRAEQGDFGLH